MTEDERRVALVEDVSDQGQKDKGVPLVVLHRQLNAEVHENATFSTSWLEAQRQLVHWADVHASLRPRRKVVRFLLSFDVIDIVLAAWIMDVCLI